MTIKNDIIQEIFYSGTGLQLNDLPRCNLEPLQSKKRLHFGFCNCLFLV